MNNNFCPLCHSSKKTFYWAMKNYQLAKCNDCGFIWDTKSTDDIKAQYEKNYFVNDNSKGGYANYFEGMALNSKTFHERLSKIKQQVGNKGKLLDIGCALGDCLIQAKQLGWENPQGTEVSKYASNFARKRGLRVKTGTLEQAHFSDNYFDVILIQDVIEHMENPIKELQIIHTILKKGGILYLITPNITGFWSQILGPLWYHYKPNEHIMYFSKKTIKDALVKSGFEDIQVSNTFHIMTWEYILNRLRYYSPFLFTTLLKLVRKLSMQSFMVKIYTDELETWATKV